MESEGGGLASWGPLGLGLSPPVGGVTVGRTAQPACGAAMVMLPMGQARWLVCGSVHTRHFCCSVHC